MSLKEFTHNKWTGFIFWSLLYLAWVIWLGNYWFLPGLGVIFDIFITRKVHWNFWKKRYKEGEKHSAVNDWLDAIIFAVIVVTFINIFFFSSVQDSFFLNGENSLYRRPSLRKQIDIRTQVASNSADASFSRIMWLSDGNLIPSR